VSSKTQSRVDGARERIKTLTARAREADVSVRTELVESFRAEETQWDEFYAVMRSDLESLAADVERIQAAAIADVENDVELTAAELDRSLDEIDSRLLELDGAVVAKEDAAVERMKSSFDAIRKLRDEAFGNGRERAA
jgi:hypothetical protein